VVVRVEEAEEGFGVRVGEGPVAGQDVGDVLLPWGDVLEAEQGCAMAHHGGFNDSLGNVWRSGWVDLILPTGWVTQAGCDSPVHGLHVCTGTRTFHSTEP
jgi:hypothetical protein